MEAESARGGRERGAERALEEGGRGREERVGGEREREREKRDRQTEGQTGREQSAART